MPRLRQIKEGPGRAPGSSPGRVLDSSPAGVSQPPRVLDVLQVELELASEDVGEFGRVTRVSPEAVDEFEPTGAAAPDGE